MRPSRALSGRAIPRVKTIRGEIRRIDARDTTLAMSARDHIPMPKRDSNNNVFAPEGAIDLHVSPEVRASLFEIIDKKPKRLVVDLSRVPYVDSSGIAVLILANQSMEQHGGQLMLAGAQEAVRTILESARLDKYFQLFSDTEAALSAR